MKATLSLTRNYDNIPALPLCQNKPNQTQFKPNLPKSKMNVNLFLTKDYENRPLRLLPQNKPKTDPIKANFKECTCELLCYAASGQNRFANSSVRRRLSDCIV